MSIWFLQVWSNSNIFYIWNPFVSHFVNIRCMNVMRWLLFQVLPSTNRYERKLKNVSCLLFFSFKLFRNFALQYLEACFPHFCHSIVLYAKHIANHTIQVPADCATCMLLFTFISILMNHDRERERDFHFNFNSINFQIVQRLGGADTGREAYGACTILQFREHTCWNICPSSLIFKKFSVSSRVVFVLSLIVSLWQCLLKSCIIMQATIFDSLPVKTLIPSSRTIGLKEKCTFSTKLSPSFWFICRGNCANCRGNCTNSPNLSNARAHAGRSLPVRGACCGLLMHPGR
jgi:hypothetical protein